MRERDAEDVEHHTVLQRLLIETGEHHRQQQVREAVLQCDDEPSHHLTVDDGADEQAPQHQDQCKDPGRRKPLHRRQVEARRGHQTQDDDQKRAVGDREVQVSGPRDLPGYGEDADKQEPVKDA